MFVKSAGIVIFVPISLFEDCVSFYRDLLALNVINSSEGDFEKSTTLEIGGTRIEIVALKSDTQPTTEPTKTALEFLVKSVEEVYQDITQKDYNVRCKFAKKRDGSKELIVFDPIGQRVIFKES